MINIRLPLRVFAVLGAHGVFTVAFAAVEISDAWIREAPPSSTSLAAYVELKNNGEKIETLVAASSPAFAAVEFHTVQLENGMMRMKAMTQVYIEPGETVVFEPGAQHLMLKKPNHRLIAGEHVPILFRFADGTQREISFDVRK